MTISQRVTKFSSHFAQATCLLGFTFTFCSVAHAVKYDPLKSGTGAYQRGDYAKALKEFRKSANKGSGQGEFAMGLMYDLGSGTPQNYNTALKWYELAAKQNIAAAQSNIGFMYLEGHGVSRDYANALKWIRLAANQGYPQAQQSMCGIYRFGLGIPENDVLAAKWCLLAANNGLVKAQDNIARMYLTGTGLPENYIEAFKWFDLAFLRTAPDDSEHRISENALSALSKQMTPSQISQGELAAKVWLDAYQSNNK